MLVVQKSFEMPLDRVEVNSKHECLLVTSPCIFSIAIEETNVDSSLLRFYFCLGREGS